MKTTSLKHLILSLTCLLGVVSLSASAASVWKVSKGNQTLYLGGTLHLLSNKDYPLPPAYKSAYEQSDQVVFETDLTALTTPEFQRKSIQKLMYSDDTTIESVLKESTVKSLQAHLASRSIPFDNVKKMKPSMMGIMLSMVELQRIGLTSQGVDAYYHLMAMGEGKAISWLETPDQQLEMFAQMGQDDPDSYINYALKEIESLPDSIDTMRNAWREGDTQALWNNGVGEWVDSHPEVYDMLLVNRNHLWKTQILDMLENEKTEFVLVGALHMAGDDGLIALLEKNGANITAL